MDVRSSNVAGRGLSGGASLQDAAPADSAGTQAKPALGFNPTNRGTLDKVPLAVLDSMRDFLDLPARNKLGKASRDHRDDFKADPFLAAVARKARAVDEIHEELDAVKKAKAEHESLQRPASIDAWARQLKLQSPGVVGSMKLALSAAYRQKHGEALEASQDQYRSITGETERLARQETQLETQLNAANDALRQHRHLYADEVAQREHTAEAARQSARAPVLEGLNPEPVASPEATPKGLT